VFLELGRDSEKGLDDILVQDGIEVATIYRRHRGDFRTGDTTSGGLQTGLASLWSAFLMGAVVRAAFAFCFEWRNLDPPPALDCFSARIFSDCGERDQSIRESSLLLLRSDKSHDRTRALTRDDCV